MYQKFSNPLIQKFYKYFTTENYILQTNVAKYGKYFCRKQYKNIDKSVFLLYNKDKEYRKDTKYMSNKTIKVSEVCFFCKKEKRPNFYGKETPRRIRNYIPCDACQEKMKEGITLIGVSDTPYDSKQFPIMMDNIDGKYPTGAWVVADEETIRELFSKEDADALIKKKFNAVDQSILTKIHDAAK